MTIRERLEQLEAEIDYLVEYTEEFDEEGENEQAALCARQLNLREREHTYLVNRLEARG